MSKTKKKVGKRGQRWRERRTRRRRRKEGGEKKIQKKKRKRKKTGSNTLVINSPGYFPYLPIC